MTRKIIAIFAALLLTVSLFACAETETTEETTGIKIENTTAASTTGAEEESTTEAEGTSAPSESIEFTPCDEENVYVLHKNTAVVLHSAPDYNDGSKLSVPNGTKLVKVAASTNGEWTKVTYDGKTYYIASQAVTTLADLDNGFVEVNATYTVITASVNVRIAPEVTELNGKVTQYNVVGTLNKNDTVKVLAINNETGWLKVEFECEYEGAVYVRYNKDWFSGDEVETTEETTEAATEESTTKETSEVATSGK